MHFVLASRTSTVHVSCSRNASIDNSTVIDREFGNEGFIYSNFIFGYYLTIDVQKGGIISCSKVVYIDLYRLYIDQVFVVRGISGNFRHPFVRCSQEGARRRR